MRPRGPLAAGGAYAWASVEAAALAPAHALADRLVFREVRAGLGGRLRFPLVGGGPLPDKVDEFFDAAGMPLLEGYGMTEAMVVIAMRDPFHRVLHTAGRVIRGMEYRLVRATTAGRAVPATSAACRSAVPTSCAGTTETRSGPPRSSAPTAGSTPTTSPWRTRTATCASSAESTTPSSSRTARTSTLPYLENELCASEWIDRAVAVGEGRPYVAAFVKPSLDAP